MKLSKNFTLEEYSKSQTADRLGIDNVPSAHHLDNARMLFERVVQKVRDHFGPTVINSGYRSPNLNKAVGGSNTSQHSTGQAVDIEVPGKSNQEVAIWIRDNLEFDQLILEGYKPGIPGSGWVHVSYANGKNRKQVLSARFENGKAIYSEGIA